jgi:CBS domain
MRITEVIGRKGETLARRMTELRVRHLPVVVDGKLKAIVSIGDIVKNRLDDRGARPAPRLRAAPVTARAARHLAVNGRRGRPAT